MSRLFDPHAVPFSRRERFLTLSWMDGALMLRSVRGGDLRPSLGRLARLAFETPGGAVEPEFELTPGALVARAGGGELRFSIGAGERLHVAGEGLAVVLHLEGSRYDYAYRTPRGEDCLVAAFENLRLMPRASVGAVEVTGLWRRDRSEAVRCRLSGARLEATLDLFTVTPPAPATQSQAEAEAEAARDFEAFLAAFGPARAGGDEARRLAAYILWSATVPAGGALSRPAVYMSKNEMINVWSWDNAFSALGLAEADPDLALDQLRVIYDRQDPSGMLPDFVHDAGASYAFTKPPVHGWTLLRLMADRPGWPSAEVRAELGRALAAQVGWWLTEARAGRDELPCYPHGNDSGWDNASFFDEGGPVLSPDLPTFLILCCDALAVLRPDEAARWRDEGEALLALLQARLGGAEGFGTRKLHGGDLRFGRTLAEFMPLLLGDRLPRAQADAMVARFERDMLTEWGPATEAPDSPHYESDGYWRGPIWAPTTALIRDGLIAAGADDLAREVATRYCHLCETSGMAENFDALTGAPLRDPAFAWTSAVYLAFTRQLARRTATTEELAT
ncbi:hypothetical protein OG2516_06976 [Oceanicola granulosus HTCC2516]|uniref:Mannosylglycerate hydrolase MGH1-like glycoside hydrolase domain-containing protein n=1 Tax=Oceanicola granulosus (strain ATCC BAA-861 / DSM 15982 / KCTC 12143 / HTCC2516) TaxID=314256 RepID=Q2CGD1_OCEGH|nr:hypothetical protein [Oceanicola granulosus]EAR51787.1 hypothetical protein OG2516_06976 [Oceanicola granulosus HTCC2516]